MKGLGKFYDTLVHTHAHAHTSETTQSKTPEALSLTLFPKCILSASCAFSCACDATVTICQTPSSAARASSQEQPGRRDPTPHLTGREHLPTTLKTSTAKPGLTDALVNTRVVTFTRERSPAGCRARQRVSATEPRAKWFPVRVTGAATSLPGTPQKPAALSRALSALLRKLHGEAGDSTKAPSLPQDGSPGRSLGI